MQKDLNAEKEKAKQEIQDGKEQAKADWEREKAEAQTKIAQDTAKMATSFQDQLKEQKEKLALET